MANEFLTRQLACNQYRITNEIASTEVEVFIKKYNELTYTSIGVMDSLTVTLDTAVLDDGVYVLKIEDTGVSPGTYYIPIYVYCSIQSCVDTLVNNLLCSAECDECTDCNDIAKEDYNKYMYEFNKITILYWMILGYINWEKVKYWNNYAFASDRVTMITKIGKMIDKMLAISRRCTTCN